MPSSIEKKGRPILGEVEASAYKILSQNKMPIDIRGLFGDQYGRGVINKDSAYVADLKKKFAKQNSPEENEIKKLAELFEMLLAQLVELENWLGEDVFITETSEFDDFRAGIDAVVEILRDGAFSHVGLAIDVTFSEKQLEKKLERIRDEIDYYELPKVKYFISQGGDFKGELSNIPRVVVAVGRKDINELATLWLDIDFLRKRIHGKQTGAETDKLRVRLREAQAKLVNHPLQIEILAQIELQIETFASYTTRKNKSRESEKFRNILSIIRSIKAQKKEIANRPMTKDWPMASFRQVANTLDYLFPKPFSDF